MTSKESRFSLPPHQPLQTPPATYHVRIQQYRVPSIRTIIATSREQPRHPNYQCRLHLWIIPDGNRCVFCGPIHAGTVYFTICHTLSDRTPPARMSERRPSPVTTAHAHCIRRCPAEHVCVRGTPRPIRKPFSVHLQNADQWLVGVPSASWCWSGDLRDLGRTGGWVRCFL